MKNSTRDSIRVYKIKCRICDGSGELNGKTSPEVLVVSACTRCRGSGYFYTDWIDFLKTPKELRIDEWQE